MSDVNEYVFFNMRLSTHSILIGDFRWLGVPIRALAAFLLEGTVRIRVGLEASPQLAAAFMPEVRNWRVRRMQTRSQIADDHVYICLSVPTPLRETGHLEQFSFDDYYLRLCLFRHLF